MFCSWPGESRESDERDAEQQRAAVAEAAPLTPTVIRIGADDSGQPKAYFGLDGAPGLSG